MFSGQELNNLSIFSSLDNIPYEQIKAPFSEKDYLQEVQAKFSKKILERRIQSIYGEMSNYSLYSNDLGIIENYTHLIEECYQPHLNLNDNLTIGIIIGNGNILSLLPDVPANDIILLDVEPVVHHFILYLKHLILNVNLETDFNLIKENLIKQINAYIFYSNRDGKNDITSLQLEMKGLKHRHFLSSKDRFLQCQTALREKDLLPICVDIFDTKQMTELSIELQKKQLKVSFINLTNVADYGSKSSLLFNIRNLPLNNNYQIISTKHTLFGENRYALSKNLDELQLNIRDSEELRSRVGDLSGWLNLFNKINKMKNDGISFKKSLTK